MIDREFWQGKKVLITGHSGFKGTWLSLMLTMLGARVHGFSNNYPVSKISSRIQMAHNGSKDITRYKQVSAVMRRLAPDVVFHLAAQAIVSEGYLNPYYTFNTNMTGTLNILDNAGLCPSVRSLVIATTDKVYDTKNIPDSGFTETSPMGGVDPYSCSKICAEKIIESYVKLDSSPAISVVRAGNTIGGCDFAVNRLIPDIYRSLKTNTLNIRNRDSVRCYMYVLDVVSAYIILAQEQYKDRSRSGNYNIAAPNHTARTEYMVDGMLSMFEATKKVRVKYNTPSTFSESPALKLNGEKFSKEFYWSPLMSLDDSIVYTGLWYRRWNNGVSEAWTHMRGGVRYYLEKISV